MSYFFYKKKLTNFELQMVNDLVGGQIKLDGVEDRDFRVWVAESSGVMGHNVRDLVGADFLSLDFAELKLKSYETFKVCKEGVLWLLRASGS